MGDNRCGRRFAFVHSLHLCALWLVGFEIIPAFKASTFNQSVNVTKRVALTISILFKSFYLESVRTSGRLLWVHAHCIHNVCFKNTIELFYAQPVVHITFSIIQTLTQCFCFIKKTTNHD